jgi:urease gamma subunit
MVAQNDLVAVVQTRLENGEVMNDISTDLHLSIIESMYLQDGTRLTSIASA